MVLVLPALGAVMLGAICYFGWLIFKPEPRESADRPPQPRAARRPRRPSSSVL